MEKTSNKKTVNSTKKVKKNGKVQKKQLKLKPIIIVDCIFLISLIFTIIFGVQTNVAFFTPFVIVLVITIVCMAIILVNAIYSKIKKVMKKRKSERWM